MGSISRPSIRRGGNAWRRMSPLRAVAVVAALSPGLIAAEDKPASPPFTPADISIGDPIALPFTPAPPAEAAATPRPEAAQPAGQPAAVPGSGWLGVTVAESNVPGRWRIDDVVAGGPAARAGIAIGDELRAVNGITLKSLEEASQAVTSIAAGQQVRIAIARADQLRDLVLVAEPRPAAPAARAWQSAEGPPGEARTPPAAAAVAAAPAPSVVVPQPPAPAPTAVPFAAAPQPFAAANALPAPQPAAPASPSPQPTDRRGRTALGVRTLPIDPNIQARFKLPEASGAYVIGVVQDLPASKAGVPPGSVIVSLDDRPVRSPVDLTQLVTSGPVDRPVTLQFVLPGGESKQAQVVLQSLDVPLEQALTGAAPNLQSTPAPRTAQRPSAEATLPLVEELRFLRARLERLERRLQTLGSPDR